MPIFGLTLVDVGFWLELTSAKDFSLEGFHDENFSEFLTLPLCRLYNWACRYPWPHSRNKIPYVRSNNFPKNGLFRRNSNNGILGENLGLHLLIPKNLQKIVMYSQKFQRFVFSLGRHLHAYWTTASLRNHHLESSLSCALIYGDGLENLLEYKEFLVGFQDVDYV